MALASEYWIFLFITCSNPNPIPGYMHSHHVANQMKPELAVSYPQIILRQFGGDCKVG